MLPRLGSWPDAIAEGRFYLLSEPRHVRWLLLANQPTLRRAGIEGLYWGPIACGAGHYERS